VLQAGSVGLLEAQVPRIGPDFIRTTDLASLDADGFLFLHGREDGAINRGGFKVLPDIVAEALRAHPDVADAAVVGRADARLGEVPVAAVELVPGASAGAAALLGWLKDRLVAYQVPTEIRIMPALPRNASMKVALHEVKALFACG
jgi:acyl-coenzyme A synthetase/AMP-(fatty) acid ligase